MNIHCMNTEAMAQSSADVMRRRRRRQRSLSTKSIT